MNDLIFQSHRYLGMLLFLLLWFMAKGTFKNVPDFYGDLATGLRTSATVFGVWRNAALVTTAVTISAYLLLTVLVYLGFESPQLLLSLIWLVPVTWNCFRLIRAEDGAKGNECLKVDMLISSGFIASVLLLIAPCWENAVMVAVGVLALFGSDLLRLDSRRKEDVAESGN